jgi:hypothetical protein
MAAVREISQNRKATHHALAAALACSVKTIERITR